MRMRTPMHVEGGCGTISRRALFFKLHRTMAGRCARLFQAVQRNSVRQLTTRRLGDVAAYFNFQRAIVGSSASINQNFADHALRIEESAEPIDVSKAKLQHAAYVSELKKLIPQVVEVPFDERFPDQVFVEEPAVCVDGTALMTQMRPASRAKEVEPLRPLLEDMGFSISEMREHGAYLDGGDVLFTGREFLIGLTQRTNSVSYFLSGLHGTSLRKSFVTLEC